MLAGGGGEVDGARRPSHVPPEWRCLGVVPALEVVMLVTIGCAHPWVTSVVGIHGCEMTRYGVDDIGAVNSCTHKWKRV